jgi:hypothetical protein
VKLRHVGAWSAAITAVVLAGCGGNPGPGSTQAPGDPCTGAWARLFDNANFAGAELTLVNPTPQPRLAMTSLDIGTGNLNDRASSARWMIPVGCRLVLYRDENFGGPGFQLVGSGRPEGNANLGAFSDGASSARWERG